MDHQDIVALIEAGDFDAAEALFRERDRRHGVSGHDAQIMQAMEKKVRARLAVEVPPPPVEEPPKKKVAKKASKPSKTPGRKSRRKEK